MSASIYLCTECGLKLIMGCVCGCNKVVKFKSNDTALHLICSRCGYEDRNSHTINVTYKDEFLCDKCVDNDPVFLSEKRDRSKLDTYQK